MDNTKDKILKAAEKLFAKNGIEGTSVRAISAKAKVNLALINYHFGSKDNLTKEVFARYILPLDLKRNQLIEEAKKNNNGLLTLRDLLSSYIIPWYSFLEDHKEFLGLFANLYKKEKDLINNEFWKVIYEISKNAYSDFAEEIYKLVPDVSRKTLLLRINIAASTASTILFNRLFAKNLEILSGITFDQESLLDYMVEFIEKGSYSVKKL